MLPDCTLKLNVISLYFYCHVCFMTRLWFIYFSYYEYDYFIGVCCIILPHLTSETWKIAVATCARAVRNVMLPGLAGYINGNIGILGVELVRVNRDSIGF